MSASFIPEMEGDSLRKEAKSEQRPILKYDTHVLKYNSYLMIELPQSKPLEMLITHLKLLMSSVLHNRVISSSNTGQARDIPTKSFRLPSKGNTVTLKYATTTSRNLVFINIFSYFIYLYISRNIKNAIGKTVHGGEAS
jgi:hypothetical protein